MYESLGRWWDYKQATGVHARQETVDYHKGDRRAFLRRHERAARHAALQGKQAIQAIAPFLFRRVADPRNLRAAAEDLRQKGETAPGPNGVCLHELEDSELWEMARTLRTAIETGTYRPGPVRKIRIPKSSGTGTRTLTLQNIEDRIVGRAIVNIVQPLLDPMFDDHSNGFRPGRNRQHALAQALAIAGRNQQLIFVTEDIKDAFDRVPIKRLTNILIKHQLPEDLVKHMILVTNPKLEQKRGLLQGQPLSPFLLNIYLDHFLDREWRKRFPNIPLFRTADDILVACRTTEEGFQVHENLQQLLNPTGMMLKGSKCTFVTDLTKGKTAEWLGYTITLGKSGFEIHIAEKNWQRLADQLLRLHDKPAATLRAPWVLNGWVDQLGPTFPYQNPRQIYRRITSIARKLEFEEATNYVDFRQRFQCAHARWCKLQRRIEEQQGRIGWGSARHHDFSANRGRSDGAPAGAPSLLFSNRQELTIYTDGSCLKPSKEGGWAYVIESDGQPSLERSGPLPRTTNNRAELWAVIRALESLPGPARVRLVTDSQYVATGISEYLPGWKQSGWRAGSRRNRRALKNDDLWQRLDTVLERHQVTCEWVKGHDNCPQNQRCDLLAFQRATYQGSSNITCAISDE